MLYMTQSDDITGCHSRLFKIRLNVSGFENAVLKAKRLESRGIQHYSISYKMLGIDRTTKTPSNSKANLPRNLNSSLNFKFRCPVQIVKNHALAM